MADHPLADFTEKKLYVVRAADWSRVFGANLNERDGNRLKEVVAGRALTRAATLEEMPTDPKLRALCLEAVVVGKPIKGYDEEVARQVRAEMATRDAAELQLRGQAPPAPARLQPQPMSRQMAQAPQVSVGPDARLAQLSGAPAPARAQPLDELTQMSEEVGGYDDEFDAGDIDQMIAESAEVDAAGDEIPPAGSSTTAH